MFLHCHRFLYNFQHHIFLFATYYTKFQQDQLAFMTQAFEHHGIRKIF